MQTALLRYLHEMQKAAKNIKSNKLQNKRNRVADT